MCLQLTLGHVSTATGTVDLTEVAFLQVVLQLAALNTHAARLVGALDERILCECVAENAADDSSRNYAPAWK